jgi:hypothetical protein
VIRRIRIWWRRRALARIDRRLEAAGCSVVAGSVLCDDDALAPLARLRYRIAESLRELEEHRAHE